MDLKDFHDFVRFLLNKEQGGWFSPDEIDTLADRAQMWFYTGLLEIYSKNQKISDDLKTFYVSTDIISNNQGVVTIPNYQHLLSLSTNYYDAVAKRTRVKDIHLMLEDTSAERLDSSILEVSIKDPVGEFIGDGKIQLYPKTAIATTVKYLRRPAPPKYLGVKSGRSLTYDKAGSTQLEWNETAINKILIKTIQMAGVNINDQMIVQYTELKNQQDI